MRTATSLALVAIGAILTFAVTASPAYLNLQIVGVIIMATGVAGLFLRKPAQGWLRRRTITRRGTGGPVVGHMDETRYPPYVMLNPGADDRGHNGHQPGDLTAGDAVEPGPETAPIQDLTIDELAEDLAGEPTGPERPGVPVSEVVEEYIDE
jgi:hypothetical protein